MDDSEKKTLNQYIIALSAIMLICLLISLYLGHAEHKTALILAHAAVCLVFSVLGLFVCKRFKKQEVRLIVAIMIVTIPSTLFGIIVVDSTIFYPSLIVSPSVLVLGDLFVQRFRGHAII